MAWPQRINAEEWKKLGFLESATSGFKSWSFRSLAELSWASCVYGFWDYSLTCNIRDSSIMRLLGGLKKGVGCSAVSTEASLLTDNWVEARGSPLELPTDDRSPLIFWTPWFSFPTCLQPSFPPSLPPFSPFFPSDGVRFWALAGFKIRCLYFSLFPMPGTKGLAGGTWCEKSRWGSAKPDKEPFRTMTLLPCPSKIHC